MIDPDRRCMSRREYNELYQEGDKTCGHERRCPDQVEVKPRLTEKREAEFSIDDPSEHPSDREIGYRMDAGGEQSSQRTGWRRYVIMARHSDLCFNSAAAEQHREWSVISDQ